MELTVPDPYENPLLYELEYQDYTKDVGFYVALSRRVGSPILELGCGSGRLGIPILEAGAEVYGVDQSQPMLDHFTAKVNDRPALKGRLTLLRADFCTLEMPRAFPLILAPFNALHHCSSTRELAALFRTAHRTLVPGGYLAFDCYLIDRSLYDRDPDERYEARWFKEPHTGEAIYSWEQSWWEESTQVHHVSYHYQRQSGTVETTHLALHMYERALIRQLFEEAGFKLCYEWSDFEGSPVGTTDQKWIVLLQRTE